jgi:hypothetical protein
VAEKSGYAVRKATNGTWEGGPFGGGLSEELEFCRDLAGSLITCLEGIGEGDGGAMLEEASCEKAGDVAVAAIPPAVEVGGTGVASSASGGLKRELMSTMRRNRLASGCAELAMLFNVEGIICADGGVGPSRRGDLFGGAASGTCVIAKGTSISNSVDT